mgnify:CR=1 FL=1
MAWLDQLERRFGRFAVPNITLGLVFGQSLFYVLYQARSDFQERVQLVPARVLEGELWRLATFILDPPLTNALFLFFALYLFYIMGRALENHWGAFRYNVFLLVGYLATVGAAFAVPALHEVPATNAFLAGSVFLAFAWLYPEFPLLLFFILPVKIKWLALLTCLGYLVAVFLGTWMTLLMIVASLLNFLLFFGGELVRRMRSGHRRMLAQAEAAAAQARPFHVCTRCGITDRTHPTMEFRYCPDCDGAPCYCIDHIFDHEHIRRGARQEHDGKP